MSACAMNGCARVVRARGLCDSHLGKLYKYGDPLAGATRAANGAGCVDKRGYRRVSEAGVQRKEHIVVAERVLGRSLPRGAVIHHVDEDKTNNAPTNLVICPSVAYHALLHMRMKALAACGNANWRKCMWCQRYDAPECMKESVGRAYHPECARRHASEMYHRRHA